MTEGPDPTVDWGRRAPQIPSASDDLESLRSPENTVAFERANGAGGRPRIVALTFLAVAAAGFLIGIAIASTVRGAKPAGVAVASQRVGPGGATVRFEGGELRVPPGALASPTRIVVRRTVVPERVQVRPPRGPIRIFEPRELVAYIFEPQELDFLRPVTLIFRLREEGGASAFARVGEATLLLGGEVDGDRRTLAVEISDFRFARGRPIGSND